MADIYWNDVAFASHFDSHDFACVKTGNLPTLKGTNAVRSSTQSVFGGYSLSLPNLTNAEVRYGDSAPSLVYGTSDWCIDFWVYTTRTTVRILRIPGVVVEVSSSQLRCVVSNPDFVSRTISSAGAITNQGWCFITVERYGDTVYAYVNGALGGTVDVAGFTLNTTGGLWLNYDSTARLGGFIDDLRITSAARYRGIEFSPPEVAFSEEGLPEPSFAVALPLSGTPGTSTFVDLTGKTVVANGGITNVSAPGNSDGIAASFTAGTMSIEVESPGFPLIGPFSIGCAVTPTTYPPGGALTITAFGSFRGDSYDDWWFDTTWGMLAFGPVARNERTTLLVTRDENNVVRGFKNGVVTDSMNVADPVAGETSRFYVGGDTFMGSTSHRGLVDDVFVVRSLAVHTENYTPYLGMPEIGPPGPIDGLFDGSMLPSGMSAMLVDNEPPAPTVDAVILGSLLPTPGSALIVDNALAQALIDCNLFGTLSPASTSSMLADVIAAPEQLQVVGHLSLRSINVIGLSVHGLLSLESRAVSSVRVQGLLVVSGLISATVGNNVQASGALRLINSDALLCGCQNG